MINYSSDYLTIYFYCTLCGIQDRNKFKSSADLEVQLVQLNHYDGVLSNYWQYLIRALWTAHHTANFVSWSALVDECIFSCKVWLGAFDYLYGGLGCVNIVKLLKKWWISFSPNYNFDPFRNLYRCRSILYHRWLLV